MLSIFTPDTLHHLMQSYGLWLLFSVIMLLTSITTSGWNATAS